MQAPPDDSSCVLLLAGGLRTTPLEQEAGLPTLMLSAAQDLTLLDEWIETTREVTETPLRLLTRNTQLRGMAPPSVTVARDSDDYRGAAGAVRDAAADIDTATATLIVCEGRRRPPVSLSDVLSDHISNKRDVTITCSRSGEFLGVYAICAQLLRDSVATVGFVDLKEQWLKRAKDGGASIGVARLQPKRPSLEILDREDLLASAGVTAPPLRFRDVEGFEGGSAVVGRTATVHATARVRDSIIMNAARVDEGAVVYRSVLGPAACVRAGEVVVNRVVA